MTLYMYHSFYSVWDMYYTRAAHVLPRAESEEVHESPRAVQSQTLYKL